MAEKGWIKLHRKVLDCWIWQEKPYDKARAWVDLLLLAMHRDKKLLIDNEVVVILRGSFMTSIVKLADRWGWSRCKVMRYLELLESEQMLNTKRTPKGTLVTIVKYEDYQIVDMSNDTAFDTTHDTTVNTTNDTADDTPLDTADDTQKKNIKNDKELKNNTCAFPEEKHDTLELFFESIWKLYPIKKGKGQVSKTKKKVLQKIGYEEIARCIARFEEDKKDIDRKYWMHGSTFFNSGYVDYLDCNYEVQIKKQDTVEEEPVIDLWSD